MLEAAPEVALPQEGLPAAPPVAAGRRPLEPHGVSVTQTEGGEEAGEGVANQGGVDVAQVARADEDGHSKKAGREQSPENGFALFAHHASSPSRSRPATSDLRHCYSAPAARARGPSGVKSRTPWRPSPSPCYSG